MHMRLASLRDSIVYDGVTPLSVARIPEVEDVMDLFRHRLKVACEVIARGADGHRRVRIGEVKR